MASSRSGGGGRGGAAWLQASAWARSGGCFAVITWGDWDLRTMLETECRFKGLAKPPCFNHWINLKIPFATAMGGGRRASLRWAVRAAGLQWEGRPHCGLDDARNTARLLVELMRRGVQLQLSLRRGLPKSTTKLHLLPLPHPVVAHSAASFCVISDDRAGSGSPIAVDFTRAGWPEQVRKVMSSTFLYMRTRTSHA